MKNPDYCHQLVKIFKICKNNKYETDNQKLNRLLMLNAMVNGLLRIGLFDPCTHFEESWVILIINQLLSYYVNNTIAIIGNNISELDLVTKFWCYFDQCFDDLRINTTRYIDLLSNVYMD